MTEHLHITACSPRSGTTLLSELMHNCFLIDGYSEHEELYHRVNSEGYKVYCSKCPTESPMMKLAMLFSKNLSCIHLLRDPRDVICSIHKSFPGKYFVDFSVWRFYQQYAEKLQGHPRFLSLSYEDLVSHPDAVQKSIEENFAFLERRLAFSDFDENADVSESARQAMGGVRKISSSSVGNWRSNMPRIKAQLDAHPDLPDWLVKYGYEDDSSWIEDLTGVEADIKPSHLIRSYGASERFKVFRRALRKAVIYRKNTIR